MKKLKLFFATLAATFFVGSQSASAATEITSGQSYYIQNVSSGLFLCGANSWGTQASVFNQGELFQLDGSDGYYTITDLALSCTNKTLGYNLFTDTDTGSNGNSWYIVPVSGKTGVFTIHGKGKKDGTADAFDAYIAQSSTAGINKNATTNSYILEGVSTADDESAQWYILTREEAMAKLSAATEKSPMDASFLVSDANFSRNHSQSAWTVSSDCNNKNLCGGNLTDDTSNPCAESWHSTFTISQTLTNVPNGYYKISGQAFYRQDGTDETNLPVFFINNGTGATFCGPMTITETDNMAKVSAVFTEGKYFTDESDMVTVTDNTITLGMKNTANKTLWCIWDNITLTYYGPASEADLKENLNSMITEAQGITGKMNADVASTLASAITAAQNCENTSSAVESASNTLSAAMTAATNSAAVYATIKALIDENATNVATLDATGQKAYDASAVQTAYDNGTITDGATETTALEEAYRVAVKAQTTANSDMTGAIVNWDFKNCSANNFPGWTIYNPNNGNAWANGSTAVEYWSYDPAKGEFNYSQEITDIPNGKYKVTAKMWNSMNNVSGTFTATSGVYGKTSSDVYSYGLVTDDIDNGSMKEYSTGEILVTDGKLTVGVKNKETMTARWFGVDYIKLTYLGNVDLTAYYNAIKELLATATAITDPQTSTASALAAAISAADGYASMTDESALTTIQANLNSAITASQASVKAYANAAACLPEMKKLVDATNVYTADALNTYYTEPKTKYDAGTLTTDEAAALQNPATVTGWHAAITCDNFLLSAWDTNPDFTDAPYYINTWSIEGANDADADGNHSGFTVPFYEYWTSDNASLGAKTLTATIPNLEVSDTYEISAWVRVRLMDGGSGEPTGITFQANDGNAVDICDGTQYTYTADGKSHYFFIKKVTTHGMVDMQGKLNIKFNVNSDNNISWLSFKDVTYTKKSPSDFWFEYPDVSVDKGATKTRYCETSSTGAMTVVSNDESIATAEYRSDGNIVIKGIKPGTTTIDVTQAADATHVASDVVTLNVTVNETDITETKTFANNGSLCYDYDATVSGADVYEFGGIYNSQIYGTKVSSVVAGKPYIVLAGSLKLTRTNKATAATTGSNYNGYYGVAGDDAPATGLNSRNLIFYQGNLWYANNSSVSKGHGYFVISEIPGGAPAAGAKALFSFFSDDEDDVTTGINAIESALKSNVPVYTLSGQRVNKAHKGIFVISGKKVTVK